MVKPGDTVRYLSATGGGKVVRVEGQIAYVDDDGFETPVRASELVVVMPAGHMSDTPGRKMFDQQAFDVGRGSKRNKPEPEPEPEPVAAAPAPVEEDFPIEETDYGDAMTMVIAFEPKDVKRLSETRIDALFVNDSNYFVEYQLLLRDGTSGWRKEAAGEAAPNEVVELGHYTQETVKVFERFVFQAIMRKEEKTFDIKTPLSVSRRLDLTKFYKLHCFHPSVYFDTPVLEVNIVEEKRKADK